MDGMGTPDVPRACSQDPVELEENLKHGEWIEYTLTRISNIACSKTQAASALFKHPLLSYMFSSRSTILHLPFSFISALYLLDPYGVSKNSRPPAPACTLIVALSTS